MTDAPNTPPQLPTRNVIPYLTVKGGKAAIEFYKRAFAATELFSRAAEDGQRLMHASVEINGGPVMLSDDFPEYHGGVEAPPPAGVVLHLNVEDADAWWDRAVEAGANVVMPLADQFWGQRYGQLTDPFGHRWSISGPLKG